MIDTFACGHPDEPRGGIMMSVRLPGLCPSCIVERDRFHTNAGRMLELVASSHHAELMRFIRQEYGPHVQYGPRRKFIKTVDPARARWLEARHDTRFARRLEELHVLGYPPGAP